jgi:RNA polymerase sigma-70 factor, ECF subfamily
MPDRAAGADLGDADLVRRIAAGDRDAFAEVYRRHHPTVFRFARLMTGSSSMAEDVVQEVFLALMRNASRYDPAKASLTTYLFGAARHWTRRRLAREKRFVELDRVHSGVSALQDHGDARLTHQEDLARLRQAILHLPSRYREAVVLCDLEDVPYAAAAESLGCPVGTVRSRLHRARRMLAAALESHPARLRAVPQTLRSASRERCAI